MSAGLVLIPTTKDFKNTTNRVEAAFGGKKEDVWHSSFLNSYYREDGQLLSVDEAMEGSKLTWKVESSPVYYMFNGETRMIPNQQAMFRPDNGDFLGNATDKYEIYQNDEHWELIRALYPTERVIDAAFSLYGGKRIVIVIKDSDYSITFSNGYEDKFADYMMAANAFTGKDGFVVLPDNYRKVCQNTFNAAIGAKVKDPKTGKIKPAIKALGVNVKHSAQMRERLADFQTAVKIAKKAKNLQIENFKALVERKVTKEQKEYFRKMIVDYLHPDIKQDDADLLDSVISGAAKIKNVELRKQRRQDCFDSLSAFEQKELDIMGSNLVDSNNAYLLLQAVSDHMQHTGNFKGSETEKVENEVVSRIFNGKATEVTSLAFDFLFTTAA